MAFNLKNSRLFNQLKFVSPYLIIIATLLTINLSLAAVAVDEKVSISALQIVNLGQATLNPDNKLLEMEIDLSGTSVLLQFSQNKRLLKKASNALKSKEFMLYSGHIQGVDKSWVRLSKMAGKYSGAIYDGTELYMLDTAKFVREMASDPHDANQLRANLNSAVIFKSSAIENPGICEVDGTNRSFQYQQLLDSVGSSLSVAGALVSQEIELTIVADTEYVSSSGGDVYGKALAQINIVDGIFAEQVGVQLSIIDIISLSANGTLNTTDPQSLLANFRSYVNTEIGNPGIAHLFTGKNLNGSVAGIAYLNAICTTYGVGVTQAASANSIVSLIAAHEIGHNFGAPHDNEAGSACSATSGRFLMNPVLNGSDQFSPCSLDQIAPRVAAASCLIDVIPMDEAPVFISVANVHATVGLSYQYDGDGTVEASGAAPITYSLDFGPGGMVLDNNGLLSWTPDASQIGAHPVQITATNNVAADTQNFEVLVSPLADNSVISFNTYPPLPYGGNQDGSGKVSVEDGGASLRLVGNRWQRIDFPYSVTVDTLLEFDFKSTVEGEIHGIGFDTDLSLSANLTFQLYGTQKFARRPFQYSGSGEFEHFVIPVGEYYTGTMSKLFFAMDHDISGPTGNSFFSNVQVYESGSGPLIAPSISSVANTNGTVDQAYAYDEDDTLSASGSTPISYNLQLGPVGMTVSADGNVTWTPGSSQQGLHWVQITATNSAGTDTQTFEVLVSLPADDSVISFNTYPPLPYGGNQDGAGTVSVEDGGITLHLAGNRWQRIDFPYSVTVDTLLEFDFKSTVEGEIQGIGFDTDLRLSAKKTFQLYGTQNYGLRPFQYSGSGEYEHVVIPVGQFYTGTMSKLFFAMDHDVGNPDGNSYFKNIKVID